MATNWNKRCIRSSTSSAAEITSVENSGTAISRAM